MVSNNVLIFVFMGIIFSCILKGKASLLSAVIGQEVVLPCDTKVNGPDETYEWKIGTNITDSKRLAFTFVGREPFCGKMNCTLRANGDLVLHKVTETDFEHNYFCIRVNENYYTEHSLRELKVPSCVAVLPLDSAALIINPEKQEYKNGTSVTFACIEGYYLNGISSSVCLLGQWNPSISATNCIASSCQAPMISDENLRIKQEQDDYKNGSYVEFTCTTGYDLYGNSNSLCLNGDWNPCTFPVCAASLVVVISPWNAVPIIWIIPVLLCIIIGVILWYFQCYKNKSQERKNTTNHEDSQNLPKQTANCGSICYALRQRVMRGRLRAAVLQSDRGNPVRIDSQRDHVKPPTVAEIKQFQIHDDSEIKFEILPVVSQSSLQGVVIGCYPGENLNVSTNYNEMETPPQLQVNFATHLVSVSVTDETAVPVHVRCLKCGDFNCTLHIYYGEKKNEKKLSTESSEDDTQL